jgi:hypothetical protein
MFIFKEVMTSFLMQQLSANRSLPAEFTTLTATRKEIKMRSQTSERKTRKAAINEMPWASWIVKVVGGYMGFEDGNEYKLWNGGKYNKRHEIKGKKYLGWN